MQFLNRTLLNKYRRNYVTIQQSLNLNRYEYVMDKLYN